MTDRIVLNPHPGLVDRVAEWLFPWLGPEAAAARSGQPVTIKAADAEASAEIEIGL
jgi:hypothetical protein